MEKTKEIFTPFDVLSQDARGRLMQIEDSNETIYVYKIWFDYTRELFNKIKVGSFLAIRNFTISKRHDETIYSILKIIKKMPTHYAMIQNLNRGYPSFSEEAARGVRDSFIDQHSQSDEDLTKILVTAIPTSFEFAYNDDVKNIDDFNIRVESNIPIFGEESKILSSSAVQKIVNGNFDFSQPGIASIGTIKEDKDVEVLIDIEKCLKTHFGIFGFTGVGKSNLLSTFISKIFDRKDHIHKILFFDIMDEYFGLLMDLFYYKGINCTYVYLDYDDLNDFEIEYFEKNEYKPILSEVFYKQMILPKEIKHKHLYKNQIEKIIDGIYQQDKIKVLSLKYTCEQWIREIISASYTQIPNKSKFIKEILILISKSGIKLNTLISNSNKDQIIKIIKSAPIKQKSKSKKTTSSQRSLYVGTAKYTLPEEFSRSAWNNLKNDILNKMKQFRIIDYTKIQNYTISIEEICKDVQKNDKSSLYIFVSSKDDRIREFLNEIGKKIYNFRRKKGILEPTAALVFDEADVFIPQDDNKDQTIKKSKKIIESYARRGRKFGLGIGLATQRVTFLDTTILAQLHTYFISKLPRKSDRDRIQEAFSFSDEELSETFKYMKGNWLLVSHEGMGIEGVPLSIKSDNANERVIEVLKKMKKSTKNLSKK